MSYSTLEALIFGGRPYYLYQFERGASSWRYTTRARDIEAFSETFTASAVRHGRIVTGRSLGKDQSEITFPASDAFAASLIGPVAPQVTTVTIWRNHEGEADTEAAVVFMGFVEAARPMGGTIDVVITTDYTLLRGQALAPRAHRTCRHVLYRGLCRLSLASHQTSTAATAVTDRTYTVTAASGQANGWWVGGMLTYDGASGWITEHDGTAITTRAAVPGLAEEIAAEGTATVLIAPGCDRSIETCNTKFSNLANHGGFPYMPETNPYSGKSIL